MTLFLAFIPASLIYFFVVRKLISRHPDLFPLIIFPGGMLLVLIVGLFATILDIIGVC